MVDALHAGLKGIIINYHKISIALAVSKDKDCWAGSNEIVYNIFAMLPSYEQVLQQNKLYYARQKLKGRTELPPEAYSRS